VIGSYPDGSDVGSSLTVTFDPRPTRTASVPSASVVNGLPESGFSFSVTTTLTPLAGVHPLGGVPLPKNDVSVSASGASAHCSATTARSVASPASPASAAGASWASSVATAVGTLTKSTAAPATAESSCTGLA